MKSCAWCGHGHEPEKFCAKRPKWSRRGFLSLVGAAALGLAARPAAPYAGIDMAAGPDLLGVTIVGHGGENIRIETSQGRVNWKDIRELEVSLNGRYFRVSVQTVEYEVLR